MENTSTKICPTCKIDKPICDYLFRTSRQVHEWECKSCNAERRRRWRKTNPEKIREQDRRSSCRKCGISFEQFSAQLRRQKGRCAICQNDISKKAHIDHCHKTKKFRGLLCSPCNLGIGMFKDAPKNLKRALRYLRMKG